MRNEQTNIHYQASEPILPDPGINFGRIGAGFTLDPEASAIIRVDCELIADMGVNCISVTIAE